VDEKLDDLNAPVIGTFGIEPVAIPSHGIACTQNEKICGAKWWRMGGAGDNVVKIKYAYANQQGL
jgi:hypothetical protein